MRLTEHKHKKINLKKIFIRFGTKNFQTHDAPCPSFIVSLVVYYYCYGYDQLECYM